MKTKFYLFLLLMPFAVAAFATPKITLTTSTLSAGNFNQGTTNNIVYAVKMKVTSGPVTINNIQFTVSGTFDNNDISSFYIYYNPTVSSISGASFLNSVTATFAAPHTYSVSINKAMAATDSVYFIIAANLSAAATDAHTIHIDGSANPVIFGYSTASSVTNSQTNKAGIQTIHAAKISLVTSSIAAGSFNQGTTNNIVYAVKMKVATEPVSVNNIQFTLSGTFDNNDITSLYIYYNTASASISGASFLNSVTATFAAPHTYSVSINKSLAVGDSVYFIIAANLSAPATDGHTIHLIGSTNPVIFGFTTAPLITNYQSDKSLTQIIHAAKISLVTSSIAAGSFNQGTTNNIVYAVKMKVATEPVSVNNIQFTLSGTFDNNDISSLYIYYNTASASISGASFLNSVTATFAAPHTYSVSINKSLAVGDSVYFIIAANLSAPATDGHTIHLIGSTNPVIFGFTTAPLITNYQSDKSLTQIIHAAKISLVTSSIAAGSFNQGTTNNIVYAVKMKVATEPVSVNNIQFTLSGTFDNNDISSLYIYYNTASASISGASFLNSVTATFAAPHTYSVSINKSLAVGDSVYFIIAANLSAPATDGHTIHLIGSTNPVIFGFTTAPLITNYQSDKSLTQTIQAADITLSSSSISSGNILKGSTNNIVYAVKMNDATEPVNVNNIQFTLSGTQDNDDFTSIYIYYNPTSASISGASFLNSATATFAAPHTYSVSINKSLAIGEQDYFIIAVNVSSTATTGHTVKINGTTVTFGFTTAPNVTNNQTNNAGAKTIANALNKPSDTNEDLFASASDHVLSNVFPNPANTSFNFSLSGNKSEKVSAQLKDRSGNVMLVKNFNINKGLNNTTLNVAQLTSGIYYLVITNEQGNLLAQKQVIIQH